MTSRRWLLLALAVTAILLLAGRALATLYVESQWFAAMGASDLWRAQTLTTAILRLGSALAGTALVFANLYAVRQSVISLVLPRRVGNLEIGEEVPGRYLMWAVTGLSIVFGLLLALPHEHWTTAYQALLGEPFGETDPYIPVDIGFFVHWLPFEVSVYVWALIAVLLVTALVVFLYALTPSLRWERGTLHVSNYVRRHLTILGALLMLLLAWSYRIDAYELLSKGRGPDAAFTSVDHTIRLPGNLLLSWFTAVGAALVLIFGWRGQTRAAFVSVTAVIVVALLVRQLAPLVAPRVAEPIDPAAREAPYRMTQLLYTRQAFATDSVTPIGNAAGYPNLESTVRRVSLWDPSALLRSVERAEGGVGWEIGPVGLIALVPRRPATSSDPTEPPSSAWTVVRALSFDADERGGIVTMRGAGPLRDELSLAPVHVYGGATGYEITADSSGRLAAAELRSGLSRLAHAWSLQNFRIFFGDLPHPRPALVRRRDIRDRLTALAPFFVQSSTVFPALLGDSLLWMVDLYATSSYYPLSWHINIGEREWGYFRHAATAIVNATTGRITLVSAEAPDPIARTWLRRFPELFVSPSDVAPQLRIALPPPIDAVRAQAAAFVRVGNRRMQPPNLQLPWESGVDSALAAGSEPMIALGGDESMSLTMPVLDSDDRLAGLLVATGGERRGLRWLPLESLGPPWSAAIGRLREPLDTALAESEVPVVRGRVRALPVAGRAALIQPTYTIRGGIATLRSVAALERDSVRVGPTLAEAVGVTLSPAPEPAPVPVELRQRVSALYETMRAALGRGDWAAFGAAFDSLGMVVARPPE